MINWNSLFQSSYERKCRDLYCRLAKHMLNVSYRIIGNKADAEDVLQEAFVSAFANKDLLHREEEFARWLKRIIVNRSIDYLRKRNIVFELNDELFGLADEDTGLEVQFAGHTVEDVKNALLTLPEGYRLVITLFLFEDYTHAEIAAALGISQGTSKSQYNRGRKKLIAALTQKNTVHETR